MEAEGRQNGGFIVRVFSKQNHALLQTLEVVNTESPLSVVKCIERPDGRTDCIHRLKEANASAHSVCSADLVYCASIGL